MPACGTAAALPPSLLDHAAKLLMHTCTIALSLIERGHSSVLVGHINISRDSGLSLRPSNLDTGCLMLPSDSTSADHSTGHAPHAGDSGAGDSGGVAAPHRSPLRGALQHAGDDWRRSLHHAAAGHRCSGHSAVGVGVGARRGHRHRRRAGLGRAGRGLPARGRFVCISARNLRHRRGAGQLAELSLCLAGRIHCATFHRFRLHRSLGISCGLLAGPRRGAHRCAARTPLRQLCRAPPRAFSSPCCSIAISAPSRAWHGCCLPASWPRSPASSSPDSPTPRRPVAGICHAPALCALARVDRNSSWSVWAASPRPRCSPHTATGATTTSAFSPAKFAGPSAPFPAPFCFPSSSFRGFIF